MILIEKTGTKIRKSGKGSDSYGLFRCPSCDGLVERRLELGYKFLSCGCARAENFAVSRRRHGYSSGIADGKRIYHPLFKVFGSMKTRCYNANSPDYKNYGGRGIRICDTWLNDRAAFIGWGEANGYGPGLQLDRINNDGNYDPSNCRFVTPAVNSRNASFCKLDQASVLEIKSRYLSGGISQKKLGELFGVSQMTISLIVQNKVWQVAI